MLGILSILLFFQVQGNAQEVDVQLTKNNIKNFEEQLAHSQKEKKELEKQIKNLRAELKKMIAIKMANSQHEDFYLESIIKKKSEILKKNEQYFYDTYQRLGQKEEFIQKIIHSLREKNFHAYEQKKNQVLSATSIQGKYPIENFLRLERESNGGVSFYYKNPLEFKALDQGTIIYLDDLTTFGKLLMIEYANNVKSVYLGAIETTWEKGMSVQKGETLGTLLPSKDTNNNKLYYEIRMGEKIIPMNPLPLLAKEQ